MEKAFKTTLHYILSSAVAISACALSLTFATEVSAQETPSQMMISGRGHGILFDGDVRAQSGVPDGVAETIWGMQGQLSAWRQHLHQHPELGFEEVNTHDFLIEQLTEMGFKPEPFGSSTGIILDIPGKDDSLTIGIRADIDALPILEVDDGRPYRSLTEGKMHACGHDAHTTIALGVAKAISEGVMEPPANLRFIFQPAEELGTGAKAMVEEGVLDGVDVIIGLHSDPTREWGRIGITSGPFSAWGNGFMIEVTGTASHGGMSPELGKDAIVAGSFVVAQLQTLVSRNVAPPDAATVTVGTFNGGLVMNQIADKAVLAGTMRAQNGPLYDTLRQRMVDVVKGASISFDLPIEISFPVEAPGVINNPAMFEAFRENALAVVGEENVDIYSEANMAGEDFSEFTKVVPGFMYWLGIGNQEKGINHTLHTPEFDIDERALPVGVALQLANIIGLAKYHAEGGEF